METNWSYIHNRRKFIKRKNKLVRKKLTTTPEDEKMKGLLLEDKPPTDNEAIKKWFPELANFKSNEARRIAKQQRKELRKKKKAADSSVEVLIDG